MHVDCSEIVVAILVLSDFEICSPPGEMTVAETDRDLQVVVDDEM